MLLTQLTEEAAEVIQAVQKCQRFGLTEVYPVSGESNVDRVVREYNDVLAVLHLLKLEGALPTELYKQDLINAKIEKVEKLMAYSASLGRLTDNVPSWHGCKTGDCPHESQAECDRALKEYAPSQAEVKTP